MTSREPLHSYIDKHATSLLFDLSAALHADPELGFNEHRAVKRISERLEKADFGISVGVGGLPTAFRAEYAGATSGPTIAFIAEYDALPDVGHGCGHNLIAAAATGAAIALRDVLGRTMRGRLVVMGCPAEELAPPVKRKMVEAGCFNDIDVALMIHGADRTTTGGEQMAAQSLDFNFLGHAAHAASKPHTGISALDAALLSVHAIELLREHVLDGTRIHGIVTDGGQAVNMVPERAQLAYWVRSFDDAYLDEVVDRVIRCAEGGAMAVGAHMEVVKSGRWDTRNNVPSLDEALLSNAIAAGAFDVSGPGKQTGSTDFCTVTHTIPASTLKVALVGSEVSAHSREYAAAAGSARGRDCLLFGAKALAATAQQLMRDGTLMSSIRTEFKSRRGSNG